MGKEGLRGLLALALGAAAMSGCAMREYLPVDSSGGRTALPAGRAEAAQPPPVQPSARTTPAADQCGAGALAYLVGKPKAEIPVAADPGRRRVVCTTCPMTRDFRPDRQTILYDEATKLVTSVACN
jgi:hypothetical protein